MDSVTSKIEQQITSLEKGSIFFPDDFVDLGTPDAIRQTLTRLCKEGLIVTTWKKRGKFSALFPCRKLNGQNDNSAKETNRRSTATSPHPFSNNTVYLVL